MPNWCRNEVVFDASRVGVEKILDFLKETIPNFERRIQHYIADRIKYCTTQDQKNLALSKLHDRYLLDFDNVIQYPEKFKIRDDDKNLLTKEDFIAKHGDDKDGYNNGGYEWCLENWGSKWNAKDVIWVPQQNTMYFDTAWAPIFPILSAIHKRFPTATITYEYYERGMGFIGGCEYIPEDYWDPSDYTLQEVHSIEMRMKRDEKVVPLKWEAGRPYNPWTSEYMGFKGG